MAPLPFDIKGIDVLHALKKLAEPATSRQIAENIAKRYRKPISIIEPMVINSLEGGIRFGFLHKHKDLYYSVTDGIEAIEAMPDSEHDSDDGASLGSASDLDASSSEKITEPETKKRKLSAEDEDEKSDEEIKALCKEFERKRREAVNKKAGAKRARR